MVPENCCSFGVSCLMVVLYPGDSVLIPCRDLIYPCSPFPPCGIPNVCFHTFISNNLKIGDFLPVVRSARPTCFTHQTHDCFLLAPPLLHRHVWQVRRAEPFTMVGERYSDAMGFKVPIQRVGAEGEVH